MTTITTAIENLYHIFGSVHRPTAIVACPCCLDTNEMDILLTTPLRMLSPAELASYASSVLYTVGSPADFRYFLPRMLDISAHDPDWYPDVEIVLGKLDRANWLSWPPTEIHAITDFAMAVFQNLLEREEHTGHEIDRWLCGFGRAGMDLAPFLRQIQARPYRKKLLEYYEVNSAKLIEKHLSNAFWDEYAEVMHQVVEWFHSSATEQAIWQAYGLDKEAGETA